MKKFIAITLFALTFLGALAMAIFVTKTSLSFNSGYEQLTDGTFSGLSFLGINPGLITLIVLVFLGSLVIGILSLVNWKFTRYRWVRNASMIVGLLLSVVVFFCVTFVTLGGLWR